MSRSGFDAVLGNPPWVLYAGKGSQPIDAREKAFLEAVHGRAAKPLSTHGLFAALPGRLCRPGGRVGLVMPTSVADASRYADVRAAHNAVCDVEHELMDIGEEAFREVFQPCMALVSTRREQRLADSPGDPWQLAQPGVPAPVKELLQQLRRLPTLPADLFGERGYRSCIADKGKFVKSSKVTPPFTTPLYEGTSIREFELLPPTAHADSSALPEVVRRDKWEPVDVFIRQTAKYPIASPSPRQAFRNSVLAGFGKAPFTAGFLLAYLNSTPVRWFHFHQQRDAQQGMPQVKVGHLRQLPAPAEEVIAPINLLGQQLAEANAGIDDTTRAVLDRLVSTGLGVSDDEAGMMAAWGRANPPPVGRDVTGPGRARTTPQRPGLSNAASALSPSSSRRAASSSSGVKP